MRRRDLEFEIDDWVLQKVSFMKGVMIFINKRKLRPRYVVPYKILKRVDKVAYEIELPTELVGIHPVLYISLLKKCMGDPSSIVTLKSVSMKDTLTYKEVSVEIFYRQVCKLRNEEVVSTKILWRSRAIEKAISKEEAAMKAKYPHLCSFYCILASDDNFSLVS